MDQDKAAAENDSLMDQKDVVVIEFDPSKNVYSSTVDTSKALQFLK